MRLLKRYSFLKLGNSYVIDAPTPSNLSYAWNFGSLLSVCLIIQIITGVTLAMHYNPSVLEAFNSVEHIMRDVNNGWFIRYLHSNTASAFFFLVYLHIGRGLYYGSYKSPRTLTWAIGTVILILMMAIGFLGFEIIHGPKWLNFLFLFILINLFVTYKTNKVLIPYHKSYNKYNTFRSICKRYYSSINKKELSTEVKSHMEKLNLDPVFIYENVHTIETKKSILNDLRELSGIYMVLNKITGDYYIGSASTNRFFSRFSKHLVSFLGSKVVKNAVKKYGIENFAFIILELYPKPVNIHTNRELLDLEDSYLSLLTPTYNILTEAGSSFGYKHSELDRQKMKENYSEERRNKIGNLNKGKKFSAETIERMRIAALNRSPMPEETRKKLSKGKSITIYNLNDTIFGQYDSILAAAEALNCGEKTIRRALKTESKLIKRQWKIEINK